ncbi:hypothetical protein PICMEDRAFT_73467 [Pichia membranifaciens NRRL Y-2026]|uniref:Carboxypeptidase n=1 Tax=Pichia membranifaciens NRRL Y-2026 TaxID=763406 RepID=A0A1E3NIN4_9ASCO|nr:hypothetical protein PICMEDRAFT_73467 [Pichia membranifaciens NRRL Y-2026]ODQ45989.1 hypothetical protein PICMEDRAFT_73467 [Pichia membranifaciens NRRL Y-2026]
MLQICKTWICFWILFSSLTSAAYIPNLHVRATSNENNEFMIDSSLIPGFQESWNDILTMHAGHIPVTEDQSSLYFWSFQSVNETYSTGRTRPLIIWLNGGPGCSSMDGALMEVGPLRVHNKTSVIWNEGWLNVGDLVFIDQPLGTGFSSRNSGDNYDTNLQESSSHLFTFVEKYFEIFASDYDKYDSIILAGESYAGQYIPHLARLMKDSPKFTDKLEALLLGNAWLDPNLQALSYLPFAIDNGIVDPTLQEDSRKITVMLENQESCQNVRNTLVGKEKFEDEKCESIIMNLLRLYKKNKNKCINVYDIRKTDSYPACGNNWPEILPDVTSFLNLQGVQNALHVFSGDHDSSVWRECDNDVSSHYNPSDSVKGASLLNGLLMDGVKVNLFSGTSDLICNYLGSEMVMREYLSPYLQEHGYQILLKSLSEPHRLMKREVDKFKMDSKWLHDEAEVGSFWQRGNLTYIKVDNASHMVAYDVSGPSIGIVNLSLRDSSEGQQSEVKTYSSPEKKRQLELAEQQKEEEAKQQAESNPDSNNSDHSTTTTKSSKRLLALFLLIIVLAVLALYFFRVSTRKPSRYSALAGAHKPSTYGRYAYEWVSGTGGKGKGKNSKKKRVHWVDLEELDEDGSLSLPSKLDSNQTDNQKLVIGGDLENGRRMKSFEMEDLELDTDHEPFDSALQHPREGSFETEELEIQLQDLTKSHMGESL